MSSRQNDTWHPGSDTECHPTSVRVVGSTVVLEVSTRRLTRFAKGGGSYLSSGDPRLLFGLGADARIRRVTVKWSWGRTQTWDGLEAGTYWELHEGQAAATRVAAPAR